MTDIRRGDRTPIELFAQSVVSWTAEIAEILEAV